MREKKVSPVRVEKQHYYLNAPIVRGDDGGADWACPRVASKRRALKLASGGAGDAEQRAACQCVIL